jgi:hypothetical protein
MKTNSISDPRRAKYFTEFPVGSGTYKGGVYGGLILMETFLILETIKQPTYPGFYYLF